MILIKQLPEEPGLVFLGRLTWKREVYLFEVAQVSVSLLIGDPEFVKDSVIGDVSQPLLDVRCGQMRMVLCYVYQVRGQVRQVVIRNQVAYRDGVVLASPGSGKNLRPE